ncbi:MAG: arylsulfatase [Firmicutes bacterium HGW-Firmicutes-1]|jgi:phosphoglycerol transferase MdoB-like AlkP superfamily enzyme|nr:MAG: arylsulfatase [Firmicutes bacterium HGW-Firmicutes-1]
MVLKIKNVVYKSVKTKLSYIETKMKQLDKYPILQLLTFSIVLIFALEMLSRRSIFKGLGFVIANPLMFIFNVLIVLLTLSLTMMFSRKSFLLVLILTIWFGLGMINFVLLGFRTTPLTAIDFYILKSVFGIIHIYLNPFQIILILLIGVVVIVAMIYLWKKMPKNKVQVRMPLIYLCVVAVSMFMVSNISFKVSALSSNFGNLAEAYSEYGFAYCFSTSLFDRGINEPDEYSEENIEAVFKIIESESNKTTNNLEGGNIAGARPNIVMVQLESFFDVNLLLDFSFSENPIPNFTQLKKTYSSGYLTVPSIGAGTANTEFEIITGMNIEHFGAGEYPYKTILQSTTCESICFNLDELGYHSHAIHNNTGTFYDRNAVFQKLGFDSYSSIEYMNNVEYNPLGWAKDNVLTTEILKALNAKETQDFIYAISVQPHGKYPDTIVDENQKIKVILDPSKRQLEENGSKKNNPESNSLEDYTEDTDSEKSDIEEIDIDESYMIGFDYFVNQLAETDKFIGELIDELSVYDEPTVVVFYGDHLPAMSFENGHLVNNNKFQTEYILWSNFPMEQTNRDLNAYQLNAYVMERLGYDEGILTKFHQTYEGEPDYQEELEILQYDMLYGDRNVFQGENPYIEKTIQMGVFEVVVTNVLEKGEVIFIEGENFTPWSVVYIEEEPMETLYIDENTLIVPYEIFTDQGIYVAQVSDNNKILSQSKEWKSIN